MKLPSVGDLLPIRVGLKRQLFSVKILFFNSPTHVGGASHGGLHKQDSLVPMIVTGTNSSPKHLRMIDLNDWILTLIN
ncbi:hypothetical protein J2S09_004437 [Bacillus fengqiuensis]|nr:hypothetical protein [Bacillus fengqiuensis]